MQLLLKFLKALNSEIGPWQIAFAVALGAITGLTPLFRLHNVLVLFAVLVFRVNISSFLAASLLFSGLAYLLDPAMLSLGEVILTAPSLQAAWSVFYDSSLGQLSQFNHTLTMGSLVVSLALFPVLLLVTRVLVLQYRRQFMAWVNKLHIVKVLKASKFYQLYVGISA